jgi:hypothetical protein
VATELKTEVINLRMAPATKQLLRAAAEHEHRTLSNMVDYLILDYCRRNGIEPGGEGSPAKPSKSKGTA